MESGRTTRLPWRRGGLVMLLGIVLPTLSCHDDAPEPLSPFTQTVASVQASLAEADRATLVEFYRATGGDRWRRRDGWLSDDPIGTWHGVRAEDGRVVRLELNDNNLRGRLPKVTAELSALRALRLDDNRLWGRIPSELSDLSELRELRLASNLLSGTIPPELKRLSRLQVLELRFAGLEGPLPAWLGELTSLYELGLSGNYFDSPIPPELGNLRNLSTLYLSDGELWGPIPPELGNLSKLGYLGLTDNHFSGSIPAELGRLARLRQLYLSRSNLSGAIPSELGNLTDLTTLWLDDNHLTGPIPSALADLVDLEDLFLSNNRLSGNLPSEIGGLSKLERLHLSGNRFDGGVPPEWGQLSSLRELSLGRNPELAGALPEELTRLDLSWLDTDASGLCAPKDAGFADWLNRVAIQSLKPCGQGDLDAYLVQATQSRSGLVPLVAGRKALLRAFVTAAEAVERFPDVRAHFYLNGAPAHVLDIPGKPGPVPGEVDQSDAAMSANAMVPGWVIQPGLEMVVEVDPNGEVDDSVNMARRIPGEGRIGVNVAEMPAMELTVIPWVWPEDPEEEIVDLMRGLTAQSEVFRETRTLLPVGEVDLTVHEPVYTSTSSGFAIPDEVQALRAIEGGSGYYMALTSEIDRERGVGGVALRSGWSAWSAFHGGIIAHELGHNLSLGHAPCGTSGDPRYPQPDGSVGSFGFDFDTGSESVVHPNTRDFMSYCSPTWVGAWHFEEMARHRQRREVAQAETGGGARSRALLLWGGRDDRDGLFLNPAFWVDAPYAPPPSGGRYELRGRSATGAQLFSVRFDMVESEDGDGRAGFAFALPARAEWSELAEVSLRGPGASAVLDRDTDRPSVILRDAATGRVRAMFIDAPAAAMAASADGTASSLGGASLMAARSRGLPDPADWRPMGVGASSAARDSGTVASITVTPAVATVALGDTLRLVATALDADSSEVDGVEVEWGSGDTLVAVVDRSGLVTALGTGSTVVTATADGVTGVADVRAEQRAVSVVLTPQAATVAAGDTVRFTATALDVHGSPMENVDFEWTASDTSVVWADRSGLAFGWSAGSATVSVRTDRGVSASADVAVEGELDAERLALTRLYARLRGWDWRESGNWLTDAPLAEWHGVTVSPQTGSVSGLDLGGNDLRGQLGPELGTLAGLERLELGYNTIRGRIPPEVWRLDQLQVLSFGGLGLTGRLSHEVGNLSRLVLLDLRANGLSGAIPPTIGELTNLISLDLSDNVFEGSFPAQILNITDLAALDLDGNRLTGEIPASLGELANLQKLDLSRNRLTGELPASLGALEELRELDVADNGLAGELPAELGGLRTIERIALEDNPALRGALPPTWVERNQTVAVTVSGTGVCAPRHSGVVAWLRMNDLTFIPVCAREEAAFAYLVQAVQSRRYPTPLVAGEDALLRVFVSTGGHADMPPVRATFHAGGGIVHTADIPAGQSRIPREIDEGDLSKSANAVVPGEVVQPGLEMVIEIDPDSTLDEGLGIPGRIPAEGRAPVDVRGVPVLDLTVIPFLQADNPDSTLLERANDLEADTSLLRAADRLLPVGELAVTVHEPVLTNSGEFAWDLLHETELIRVVEGGDGYFMGLFGHIRAGVIGQASYIGGRSFVSLAHAGTVAHELGHAMGLLHTPCGVQGDDPNYPWRDGRTGSWGYDFANGAVVPPEATDLMGYCGRQWISGYHFSNALDHRLRTEAVATPHPVAEQTLVVWGGVDAGGQPYLKPAFAVEAPPKLPAPGGDHRLTVLAAGGETLFSVSFDMRETAHLDGASSFVFAIPAPEGWVGAIGRITLDGPGGTAALDPETGTPAIIVRDPDDGRVLGLLTDPPPNLLPSADGPGNSPLSGFDLVVSSGLPEVPSERR